MENSKGALRVKVVGNSKCISLRKKRGFLWGQYAVEFGKNW